MGGLAIKNMWTQSGHFCSFLLLNQKNRIVCGVSDALEKEVLLMEKKYVAGIFALAVCIVAASGAYAFGGLPGLQGNDAAKQALESKDYAAFVEAMAPQVSEEMFNRMAEQAESEAAIEAALESGDYEAWVAAIESRSKITDFITADNFADYVVLHNAKESGDFETARSLAEGLGIGQAFPPRGIAGGPPMGKGHARNGFKGEFREGVDNS